MAVSYTHLDVYKRQLSRFDLAHVEPTEGGFDALGRGVEEGKPSPDTRYCLLYTSRCV